MFQEKFSPTIIAATAVGTIAVFIAGVFLLRDEPQTDSVPEVGSTGEHFDSTVPLDERLLHLERVIAEERNARLILEDQLHIMIEEIERIDLAGSRATTEQKARVEEMRNRSQRDRRTSRDYAEMARSFENRRVARMVERGFSEDEARQMLELESESQFQAMTTIYEAQRNGESSDIIANMTAADSILRARLGDEQYARYLESQGHPSAIQVVRVMGGSPASKVGLQSGDRIIGYNGQRVFSMSDVRNLSAQGRAGENVIVEVERDGVTMQLSLPRGPLGVTGSGMNMRPSNFWDSG